MERRQLRGDLPVAIVAGAAIRREIPEHRPRLRIAGGDARRVRTQRGIGTRQQLLVEQRPQRHHVRSQRLAVNRIGIPVMGQLQGIDAERPACLAVTRRAVAARRDVVLAARRNLHRSLHAILRRERGAGARRVPHVAARQPSRGGRLPQEPRLDAAAGEAELLPQPRPDRELPAACVAPVDRRSGRQLDPSALGGTIRPQRVLRTERADPAAMTSIRPGAKSPVSSMCSGSATATPPAGMPRPSNAARLSPWAARGGCC